MPKDDLAVNQSFLDQYNRIVGSKQAGATGGRSPGEQIAAIRNSVENKLKTQQEVDNAPEDRRRLEGPDAILAQISSGSDAVASGLGNAIFGDPEDDNPLEFVGRTLVDLPGGIVTMPTRTISRVGSAITGTDYSQYDPATETVPEGEEGELNALGRLGQLGSAALEVGGTVLGAGAGGRVAGAATKALGGAARGAVTKEAGAIGQGALKGFTGGLRAANTARKEAWENLAGKNFATRALTTAAEEAAQEVGEESVEWVSRHDDEIARGDIKQASQDEFLDAIAKAAVGGAIGGGAVGAIGGGFEQFAKRNQATVQTQEQSQQSQTPDQALPSIYRTPTQTGLQAMKDASKPDATETSGSGTAIGTRKYGINEIGYGINNVRAIYSTPEGEKTVNSIVGAENVQTVREALLNSDEYVSPTTGNRGVKAAKEDLDRIVKRADKKTLNWKYPASAGHQMLMDWNGVEDGTGVFINEDVAGFFGGDFDGDLLGFELAEDAITDDAGTVVKVRPSQMLLDEAVGNKTVLDPDYVEVSRFSPDDKIAIRQVLVNAGIPAAEIQAFFAGQDKVTEDKSQDAYDRLVNLSSFLSKEGKDLSNNEINAIWNIARKSALTLSSASAQNRINQSTDKVVKLFTEAVDKGRGFAGTVKEGVTRMQADIMTGTLDPHAEGNMMRIISATIFREARRGADISDPTAIEGLTVTALERLAHKELGIVHAAMNPVSFMLGMFEGIVAARVRAELEGRTFTDIADFMETYTSIAEAARRDFESTHYYDQLKRGGYTVSKIFPNMQGITSPSDSLDAAIIGFQRCFASSRFSEFFNAPELGYEEKTIAQVFTEIEESPSGFTDAFVNYGSEQEQWNRAARNAQSRTAKKIGQNAMENVRVAFEGEAELELTADGIVAESSYATAYMRFSMLVQMLRSSVSELNLITMESILNWSKEAHAALVGKDYKRFFGLALSLRYVKETMSLKAAMDRYTATKDLADYKRMLWAANDLAQDNTVVYKITAAQVATTKMGEEVNDSLYNVLSSLYKEDSVDYDTLERYLGKRYELGNYGTSLGSLAADVLNTSDDVITLQETRNDMTAARRIANRIKLASETYAKREFDSLMWTARNLNYSNNQIIQVLHETAKRPTLIEEEILSEQMRGAAFLSNAAKEKADDTQYSILLASALIEISNNGRVTANEEMFDIAGGTTTAEKLFMKNEQLIDLVFSDDIDTPVTVIDEYGKASKIITKTEFYEELTGVAYDPKKDKSQQILNLLSARPKLLIQLGLNSVAFSPTGTLQVSRGGKAEDAIIADRSASPEERREQRAKEWLRSQEQANLANRPIILEMMSSYIKGADLPYDDSAAFARLFRRAWKEYIDTVYSALASTELRTTEHILYSESRKRVAEFLESLKRILADKAWILDSDNALIDFAKLANRHTTNRMVDAAISRILPEVADLISLPGASVGNAESAFTWGTESALEDERNMEANLDVAIAKIDNLLESFGNDILLLGDLPTRDEVIEVFRLSLFSLPARQDENILAEKQRESGFTGSREDYKKHLFDMFSNRYTEEIHQAEVANSSTRNLITSSLFTKRSIDDVINDPSIMEQVEKEGILIGGKKAEQAISELIKKREQTASDLKAKVESTVAKHHADVENISRGNLPSEQKQKGIKVLHEQVVSALSTIENDAILAEDGYESQWSEIKSMVARLILAKNIKKIAIPGRATELMGLSLLEQLHSSFFETVDTLKDAAPADIVFQSGTGITPTLPPMQATDATISQFAQNAQMSMLGGAIPGNVAISAEGTGWESVYGTFGESAECAAKGKTATIDEALTHDDLTKIVYNDGTQTVTYSLQENNPQAMMEAIQAIPPSSTVVAFYRSDCLCPGVCTNHSLTHKNNVSTTANPMSSFYKAFAMFMQEIQNLRVKKKLTSSDITKAIISTTTKKEDLLPRFTEIADLTNLAEINASIDLFEKNWAIAIGRFIKKEVNENKTAPQDKVIDPKFARELAAFSTRFARIRLKLEDGTVFEENCPKQQLEQRLAELETKCQTLQQGSTLSISPVMVGPKESAQAATRYAASKATPTTSRAKLLMDGLQNPGHRIVIADQEVSLTQTETFAPGTLNLSNAYGSAVSYANNPSGLSPSIDQATPMMQYLMLEYGNNELTAQGDRSLQSVSPILISQESSQATRQIMHNIFGEGSEQLELVNLKTSERFGRVPAWLRSVPQPVSASNIEYRYGEGMPPISIPNPGVYPAVILDEFSDRILDSFSAIARSGYDSQVVFYVPKGSIVQADFLQRNEWLDFDNTDFDAYVLNASRKKVDTNGFSLAPNTVEGGFHVAVGGPVGNATTILPSYLNGQQVRLDFSGFLDTSKMTAGRDGQVSFLADGDRPDFIDAYNNSLLPNEDRDPSLPTIDWGERGDNLSKNKKQYSVEAFGRASLNSQNVKENSREGDLLFVLELPPDSNGDKTYAPIFLEDVPGFAAEVDTVRIDVDPSGKGFYLNGVLETTFDSESYRKALGFIAAYKGYATPAVSVGDTPVLVNGQGTIVLAEKDLISKTQETKHSDNAKLWIAYQLRKGDGTLRNLFDLPSLNPELNNDPDVIEAKRNPYALRAYRKLLSRNLKDPTSDKYNTKGEALFKKFLRNVMSSNGISPGIYLNPGFMENGIMVGRQTWDPAFDMIFQNFANLDEVMQFWSYITDGELCPDGVYGEYSSGVLLNSELLIAREDGELVYWDFVDSRMNFDGFTATDRATAGAVLGNSQSAVSSMYTPPAIMDVGRAITTQEYDAGVFGPMTPGLIDDDLLMSIDDKMNASNSTPSDIELFYDETAERYAAGTASGNNFYRNLSDGIGGVRRATLAPIRIVATEYSGDTTRSRDLTDEEVFNIKEQAWKITGQDRYDDPAKRMNFFTIRQLLSSLVAYSKTDGSDYVISYEQTMAMLDKYKELLNEQKRMGQFPRDRFMQKEGDPLAYRYGMIGNKLVMDLEWSFPNVRLLFDGDKQKFLKAASDFQKDAYRELINSFPENSKKIAALLYYQEYLQQEWQDELDVGDYNPLTYDAGLTSRQVDVYEALGVDAGDAALQNYLADQNKKSVQRLNEKRREFQVGLRKRRKNRKIEEATGVPVQDAIARPGFFGSIVNTLRSLRITSGLIFNAPLAAGAIARTVTAGYAKRQANKFRLALGKARMTSEADFIVEDYDLIIGRSTNNLLKSFVNDVQMVNAWGESEDLLAGYFSDNAETQKRLRDIMKQKGKLTAAQRSAGRWASGFGFGNQFVVEAWITSMSDLIGDTAWLSSQYGTEVTEPLMSKEEWNTILKSDSALHDFLARATQPDSPYNRVIFAAMENAQKITHSQRNGVYQLMNATLGYFGGSNAQGLFATAVYPFMNFAVNVSLWSANIIYAFPSETLLYALHHNGRKLQQFLSAYDKSHPILDSINWETLDSGKGLKDALIRDAVKYGGFQLLALLGAGLLQVGAPEDDDLKDDFSEYTIFGMRIKSLWPLQDLVGPIMPLIVYYSQMQQGNTNQMILWRGFYETAQNSATSKASSFVNFMSDPFSWADQVSDADMAFMNGENPEEFDPAQAMFMGTPYMGLAALYDLAMPKFVDDIIEMFQTDTDQPSANFIYEEDDSGRPTGRINPETGQAYLERADYDDVRIRRITRYRPTLGFVFNLINQAGLVSGNGKTGYMAGEMPDVVRYDPYQMNSLKMYELTGDQEHDSLIAADVITMLNAYDDMDALVSDGFYISSRTRFYVGQKIWDNYWALNSQIETAKENGWNDYYALGNGDFNLGQKTWNTWLNDVNAQKQYWYDLYHEKLNSGALRQRMATANMMQQYFGTDAAGQRYGTGYASANPWNLFSAASRNNAGAEEGWSSESIVTGLPVGERGWRWNTANSYYDSVDFEAHSEDGEGKNPSAVFGGAGVLDNIAVLADLYSTAASTTPRYSYRSGGGGGGGGSSYSPRLYNNPQDIQGDYATVARMDRLYDSQLQYLRPEWETKGSREAYRRGDI